MTKNAFYYLLIYAAGICTALFFQNLPKPMENKNILIGYYVKCNDGDTCVFKDSNNRAYRVRLMGIDAPEMTYKPGEPPQAMAQESKDFVNNTLAALGPKTAVDIHLWGQDVFNRLLGEIALPGQQPLNIQVVERGLAEVYAKGLSKLPHAHAYWKAQRRAQGAKRGIWSLGNAYVPPGIFRKIHARAASKSK